MWGYSYLPSTNAEIIQLASTGEWFRKNYYTCPEPWNGWNVFSGTVVI